MTFRFAFFNSFDYKIETIHSINRMVNKRKGAEIDISIREYLQLGLLLLLFTEMSNCAETWCLLCLPFQNKPALEFSQFLNYIDDIDMRYHAWMEYNPREFQVDGMNGFNFIVKTEGPLCLYKENFSYNPTKPYNVLYFFKNKYYVHSRKKIIMTFRFAFFNSFDDVLFNQLLGKKMMFGMRS